MTEKRGCGGCGLSCMNRTRDLICGTDDESEYRELFEGKDVWKCPTCGYTELHQEEEEQNE